MPADPTVHALLDAALSHVAFDGWSEATFRAAARDAQIDLADARLACPRGALDLAVAYHRRGDDAMRARLKTATLGDLRFREKVATALRFRIEAMTDKEAVRRATTLFALPQHGVEGARLVWETADAVWDALGDTSDDINWYTKRATLSGVWGATVLYWLGDDSPETRDTWAFIDRRIEDVMQIEKAKAMINDNPVLRTVFAGPNWLAGMVKAPPKMPNVDLPGGLGGFGTAPRPE